MATKLKIEKMGDEILIVHCCFSISQNELIYTDYANKAYFDKRSHLNLLL
jgi:hypothetical protein